MKTYGAYKLRDLLALVRAGEPIPGRLLDTCEQIIGRELGIQLERGRRTGEFFTARAEAEAAGVNFDGAKFAQKQTAEAKREKSPYWREIAAILARAQAADDRALSGVLDAADAEMKRALRDAVPDLDNAAWWEYPDDRDNLTGGKA